MKTLIISLILSLPAAAASLTVCTSGCTYSTAQAALNASSNGDTILLTAGQNLGGLTIPGNRHDLTIKSTEIDKYPRGYRMTRNNPALARLTGVTVGDTGGFVTPTVGSSTLAVTVQLQPALAVGDKVVIGGSRYSAYVCSSLNQPPYVDGGCDASRVGYMNIRTDTKLVNGSVLYFLGRTLPTPLQLNTPYYVVNFVRGGSAVNADKFQIAAAPGGAPIAIPQFDPAGQDLVVEVRPLPQQIGDVMYVVATPTPSTVQLSTTPGGTPTVWKQVPYANTNAIGLAYGFSLTKVTPVYNITFDGIEVSPATDAGVFYLFYVSSFIANLEGEHHDIHILRSWLHGADDQEDFPQDVLNIAGRNLEIGWSVIENAYSTGFDTQDIEFISTGNVSIHDNELKGAAESIMSGGNIPWFAFITNTKGISVFRNYFWKPLKAYIGIIATYVNPTQFQLVSRAQGADCSTVATNPNLGFRCFAYEAQETPGTATPPSNPVISRTEWTASTGNSIFTATGTAGQVGYIYLLGGAFHMDYNFSGSVSCPAGVTCARVTTPAFPVISTRIGIAVIGSAGTFDSTFFGENRNVFSKNLIESKYGDDWLMEGNVFHRQSNCDAGVTCQDPAIQFTVAGNGSGIGDPVNYLVSSSNSIIRNNIFRMLSAGINGNGKTFPAILGGGAGENWEIGGFGRSQANRVENNLFMDLGSTEYQPIFDGSIIRESNTQSYVVQHNTAVDSKFSFWIDAGQSSIFRSNIVTPYRSSCAGYNGCSSPAATTHVGVQDETVPFPATQGTGATSWAADVAIGNVDSASSFDNNIIMNRMGVCCVTNRPAQYPNSTYLVTDSDPGRDPNVLFTSWQERDNSLPPAGLNYRAANFRLAPGKAALYPAYDNKAIGADIDEIEAFTGKAGIDVENGWPMFSVRTARTISTGVNSAVISYLPNGSFCTIELWPNSSYSGTPTVNTTDRGIPAIDGRISVLLTGLSARNVYYGKRWCGPEVDVFQVVAALASVASSVQLAAPAAAVTCAVEYGNTAALGSVTSPVTVTSGTCSVTVPADVTYWRHVYISGSGATISRGETQHRGL